MKVPFKTKAALYACFAAAAGAFVVAFFALGAMQDVHEGERHAIIAFSASSTSGIMLSMGAVLAFWGLTVKIRCSDRFVRRCLISIATLFALWMLLVVLKYACSPEYRLFITFSWYFFYVPIIAAPALCFICALRVASFPSRVVRPIAVGVAAMAFVLIALVFTNNLHFGVFSFDPADPKWQSHYTYELGYRVIVAWQVALIVAFLAIITFASRSRLWRIAAVIGVFVAILFVYALLYRMRIEAAFKSNFALNYVIMFTLLMELCLDFGIFPSFTRYRQLFENLPFDINVFSHSMRAVYRTRGATQPSSEAFALVNRVHASGSAYGCASSGDGSRQFLAWAIQGGTALLTEDRAELNERARRIRFEREALERGNRLLRTEIELKSEAACIDSEVKLVGEIRASLSKTFKAMHAILDELQQLPSESIETEAPQMLQRLRFLVAYCKRKSSLLLMEKSGEDFNRERLLLVANELAVDARASGIECAAFVDCPAAVSNRSLSAIYDCLYNVIMLCFELERPVLLISATRRDEDNLGVDVVLEYDDVLLLEGRSADDRLLSSLKTLGLAYRFSSKMGGFTLSIAVPIARAQGGDAA